MHGVLFTRPNAVNRQSRKRVPASWQRFCPTGSLQPLSHAVMIHVFPLPFDEALGGLAPVGSRTALMWLWVEQQVNHPQICFEAQTCPAVLQNHWEEVSVDGLPDEPLTAATVAALPELLQAEDQSPPSKSQFAGRKTVAWSSSARAKSLGMVARRALALPGW